MYVPSELSLPVIMPLSLANFAIVFGSVINIIVQSACGSGNRLGVFIVMAVLSIVALIDVLPFSRRWNADLRMLDERKREMSLKEEA